MLETLTTAPRPRSIMPGSTARVRCSTAVTLTSSWRCSSSAPAVSSEPAAARPALLTSRSTGATSGSASRAATWSRPAASARSAGSTSTTTSGLPRVRGRGVEPPPVAGDEHEVVAVAGEPGDERGADAGRRPGDHGGGHTATLGRRAPSRGTDRLAVSAPSGRARARPARGPRRPRRGRRAGPAGGRGVDPTGAVPSTQVSSAQTSSTSSPMTSAASASRGVSSGRTASASETKA